jgi:thioesterase domain-containing protein/acyl carrier protein
VPAAFVALEAMPLNPNQKVDRRALPMPTPENLAGFKAIVPPRNDWERQVIEIWENVLNVKPIGIQNNFFELGGSSLLAVQMLSQIEKRWGINLPITTLLQAPTIEALVKVLCDDETAETMMGDLVPLRSGGNKPPLFCIYGILLYQELVNHLDPDRPVYGVYLQEEVDLLKAGTIDQQDSLFSSVPNIAARYLQAIRTLQPHGPYYLAGESFGGVMALEMAQQLREQGEEVELVALFDSWLPSAHTQLSPVDRLKWHVEKLSKHGLSYIGKKIVQRLLQVQQKFLTNLYKVFQKFQPSANNVPQDIRAAVRQQMNQSYVPKPYPGKMVLFRAMERDEFEVDYDRDLGWGTIATGSLQIFDIPGDHLGILQDPNVQLLAEKLQLCLD